MNHQGRWTSALGLLLGGAVVLGMPQPPWPDAAALQKMTARFAPVDIGADIAALPAGERRALAKLVQAGRIMDAIYLRQVWGGNQAVLVDLLADTSATGRARLHAFLLNKGPWSELDAAAAFVPGVPAKPGGGNFYPAGATKAEVETWLNALPEAERRQATGFFTTIRRGADGRFHLVPYSIEYQGELARAAELLREAARLTGEPTLSRFLESRADAFLSNDYYASDAAWMELDAAVEPTIGPYEVYTDEWFNYKAAFEAFITVRDATESAKLATFGDELQDIEDHLPMPPPFRNPRLGAMAPIRVVNVVLASGDGNHGVQTAAFNLPNDERIIREKGSKRVMLKNMQDAKFRQVLIPISRIVLAPADQANVSFDAFFTPILMHELMHGLGPHDITVEGRKTTVRQEMKELYSALEEAKADISGLFALQYLIDKRVLDASMERTMYTTFLASALRSIRFGVNEAHGRGIAVQLNALLDAGAITVGADGTFSVNAAKIKPAVEALTRDILVLQAQGDYAGARQMIERLAVVRPDVQRALDRLGHVPVDIEPRFVTAAQLGNEG